MAVNVETLENLERRITLTLSSQAVQQQVETRLKRLARTVKIAGFRPGKVPLSMVSERYGDAVQYEVVNDEVKEKFSAAVTEANLRVAGFPRISEKEDTSTPEGELVFNAVFEVYPEIKLGDLTTLEIEKINSEVTENAIDKTVDILRKQHATFEPRATDEAAADGDRVTIDFQGKIDGEPFAGGTAQGFQFLLGEKQMLDAFEKAVQGMKVGESKTFPLQFPEDYGSKDVAGKEADFLVTVQALESQHLPEPNDDFAQILGIANSTFEGLRADIRKNLEREIKYRVSAKNKAAAMDGLLKIAELEVPKTLVHEETERMVESAHADLTARGFKNAEKSKIPPELFTAQAERRVKLGLIVAELVKTHHLRATPDQLKAYIEELSQSYEKPQEVVNWYFSDRQKLAEVEAVVLEGNVTDFVFAQAKVVEKTQPFDELMGNQSA